ncbi:uncharacterized protein [Chironomus tepperi]|uniref:uncharacterized protein n=1 Tax=Chironomus tepperi TaxID=113505 RepID=UPI00391FA7ED
MFNSVKNKFLFCLPLLGGCFFIGAFSSLAGAFLLVFTLYNLPLERLALCESYYYTNYMIFLTTLVIYYVGLIFAGFQTMYGVVKRKHSKLLSLLIALIVHPLMYFSYKYVYTSYLGLHYFDSRVKNEKILFIRYNGSIIYFFAIYVAGYFAFCIINGMRMIEIEQNDRKSSKYDFENFKTFLGFLSLETGAKVIASTSVILGIGLTFSLCNTGPWYSYYLEDIVYFLSLSIVSLYYAALVVGGILMTYGIKKKDPKKMKPLMTTLFVQPALLVFFFITYFWNNFFDISFTGMAFPLLTIIALYFGFCIRNLLKSDGYEAQDGNISYERVENLDDVTFDASKPNGIVQ